MAQYINKPMSPIHQWTRLNQILAAYRYAVVILSATLVGFLVLTFWLVERDTLVIAMAGNEKLFFTGNRTVPNISETDVVEFSKLFIKTRYSWDSFRIDNLVKELAPITSEGLLQKIDADLTKSKTAIAQNAFAQDVLIRTVTLNSGNVLAAIDRVIQISDKMKVVSPLELSLTLIRGKPNRYNPLGLYVNTVTEHEVE